MKRGQHHLRRPRQPQIVVRQLVGLVAMAGELPLVEERLLARDRRHGDRGEAGPGDPLQRPGHQLGLEQRQPPLQAIGPRPRNLGHPRQIAPPILLDQRNMVERLEIEVRRRALGADDDIEALVRPDRSPVIGQARKLQLQGLEFGFLARKLAFKRGGARPRLLRLPPKLRFLLRRRVLEARADGVPLGPQPIDFGLAGAHFGVERQQRVQIEIDVLDRIARSTASRLALTKSRLSMAAA